MIRRTLLTGLAALLLLGCGSQTKTVDATYYLVRHAEKTAEKLDPGLTQAGQKRASDLADRLSKIPLTAVYSSDYIRTRDTAAPIAILKNLEVILYDPRDLDSFAKGIVKQNGHILIVGHSNTTPQLSALLGGPEGTAIVEATEYDRLYILERRGENVTGRIETYGE
ncbi:SixA phosphatase family protein [Hellea balneolensis]|uniref:SixA phosphatase family protein n=1 Tax=Hellea balneolensis TaxID=287478 RepID=UPI00041D7282|nr:histidine phosphatase family protein [Hellea balneolensis]